MTHTKLSQFFLVGLLAAGFALIGNAALQPRTQTAQQQSVLSKVLIKGELRCGYTVWPGAFEQDPNTGKFSGAFYDYMEAVGRELEVKITWTEEVNFGDIPAALNAGRIDAMCSGVWTNTPRGKFVDFTVPIAYNAIHPYVRSGDHRFDNNIDAINQADVKISMIDGESAETIAKTDFPNAAALSMPKGTEASQMLLNVLTRKADVTFMDAETAGRIMAANPGKMRAITGQFPLRVFGLTLAVKKDEGGLRETLDNTTRQLLMTGVIDRILNKYEKSPGSYLRVQLPFKTAAN